MNENHRDNLKNKHVANEVKLWLPPSFIKNEAFIANGQKLPGRGARKKGWIKWGFADKEVWDWFLLISQILGAITIPFVVLVAGLYFTQQLTQQQTQLSEKQHQVDLQIAADQQEEAVLNAYLDDITTLLLDKKLGSQAAADEAASAEAAVIAHTKTLIALDRLKDPRRKATIVEFLYSLGLIGYTTCDSCTRFSPIIGLSGADLNGADLRRTWLEGVDLSYTHLNGADLSGAIMYYANLSGADLSNAHLNDAYVNGDNFGATYLTDANLSGTTFRGAQLINAVLFGADLTYADLSGVHLNGANLSNANLSNARLHHANLNCNYRNGVQHNSRCTNLSSANLHNTDLRGADLSQADLLFTDLSGTFFSDDTNLNEAYLSPRTPGAWPASLNCLFKCYQGDAHLYPNGLVGADLHGADLSEADLNGANLSKADLSSR